MSAKNFNSKIIKKNNVKENPIYTLSLSFEEIKLPPFQEILVVGKNTEQGKIGLSRSFELLNPDGFEVIEDVNDEKVEAVFINKKIIKKIPTYKIIKILKNKVFPYISEGELVKVDLKIRITYNDIETNF